MLQFHRLAALLLLLLALLVQAGPGQAAPPRLTFDELYSGNGVLGLTFSEKLVSLEGREVVMPGFMAPPLKAEADFFVLTKTPVSLCPFCQSDADWPDDIMVVYLGEKSTFVQNNTPIEVTGVLETGSFVDGKTGFLSRLRLRNAVFRVVEPGDD